LGEEYRITTNYFKLHACCRINHYALDALARIARAHPFAPDDVEQVRVTSIPFGERMAEPSPATMLAAKFSIPYAVAASLVLGRTDVAAFEEGVIGDPRVQRLAARVEIASDPEMNPRRPDDYPTAVVTVALRDGRTLTDSTIVVHGDAAAPADPGEVIEKFEALAGPVLGRAGARAVVEVVDRVDELKDIRELTALTTMTRTALAGMNGITAHIIRLRVRFAFCVSEVTTTATRRSGARGGRRAAHHDRRRLDAADLDVDPPRSRSRSLQRKPDEAISLAPARAAADGKAETDAATHSDAAVCRSAAPDPDADGRRWCGRDGG
jgi:hypothetical protein